MGEGTLQASRAIVDELKKFIDGALAAAGGDATPIRPSHRVPFRWPPHPVSFDYHVLPSDWSSRTQMQVYGETFDVQVAKTAVGVFGKCERLWNEARGETLEEMTENLKSGCEPYFRRQFSIGETIGRTGRYDGLVQDLEPTELVKLLYCADRDVAHEAHTIIETRASSGVYSDALIEIVTDRKHPARRIAQWCALDMFEDLPAFYPDTQGQNRAVAAVKGLMWEAEDDHARTIYKAGVVLGGHVCTDPAADALIDCIGAPSPFGRRSAIHAVFHLNEWMPSRKGQILTRLRNSAATEDEPLLREFAGDMARDIEAGAVEHVTEPVFPEEA
ncbi:MAG: hypothetical protein WD716_08325 [Fimbriimonadaceae bacterium]